MYQKCGFTLIELLVVVLIIGILASVALPQYQTAVDKSRYSTLMAMARAIKNEQELYYLSNGVYSSNLEDFAGTLPADCTFSDANNVFCEKMSLYQNPYSYLATRLSSGIDNSFVLWYDHSSEAGRADCYAYRTTGERGRRLCASLGATKATGDNEGCDHSCTIYHFN